MTLYRYRAFDQEGFFHKGSLEANSRGELGVKLRNLGYSLISCSSPFSSQCPKIFFFRERIKLRDLKDFWGHLEQFETAGIPLKDALEELVPILHNRALKRIIATLNQDIQAGILLSDGLLKHPHTFDPIAVGLARAGERTGRLAEACHYLTSYLSWKAEVQGEIFKTLRYPLIMAVFLIVAIGILLNVLVPELISFLLSVKQELPFSARLLIWLSSITAEYWPLLVGVGLSFYVAVLLFIKYHPQGQCVKSYCREMLPFFGPLQRKLAFSHFFYLFSVLWQNGVDILQALEISAGASESVRLQKALTPIRTSLEEGCSLSQSLEKSHIFPSFVVRMIHIGEKTNSLQTNLMAAKIHFETSLRQEMDTLISLIGPVSLAIMGGLIGWIAASVFLPIYEVLVTLEC